MQQRVEKVVFRVTNWHGTCKLLNEKVPRDVNFGVVISHARSVFDEGLVVILNASLISIHNALSLIFLFFCSGIEMPTIKSS